MKLERELNKMITDILSGLDEMEGEDGDIALDVEEFDEKWFLNFDDDEAGSVTR